MNQLKRFSVVILVATLTAGFTFSQSKTRPPNFSLESSDGKTIELAKLRGKIVVVSFWTTWCGPCRAEIPGFLDVYNKYKSKGLEIVGISLDNNGWEAVKPLIQKFKITYPVALGEEEVVLNYGGIQAIPTTFIVDRNGYVVYGHVGYFPKEQFASVIEKFFVRINRVEF